MKLPPTNVRPDENILVSDEDIRTIQREAALWALEEAAKVAGLYSRGISAEAAIRELKGEIE
jgi:hypothetical protein